MRRHVLRPASLGLVNVVGLNIGSLLSGALIVELVFGIGGLGQVLLESTINRDLNPLLGLTVYTVGVYVVLNAIVDLLMPILDPRIRGGYVDRR
jgi:peptide/nickel transport system permease protein